MQIYTFIYARNICSIYVCMYAYNTHAVYSAHMLIYIIYIQYILYIYYICIIACTEVYIYSSTGTQGDRHEERNAENKYFACRARMHKQTSKRSRICSPQTPQRGLYMYNKKCIIYIIAVCILYNIYTCIYYIYILVCVCMHVCICVCVQLTPHTYYIYVYNICIIYI